MCHLSEMVLNLILGCQKLRYFNTIFTKKQLPGYIQTHYVHSIQTQYKPLKDFYSNILNTHNLDIFVKRGSRGAARAAKSLRWSV